MMAIYGDYRNRARPKGFGPPELQPPPAQAAAARTAPAGPPTAPAAAPERSLGPGSLFGQGGPLPQELGPDGRRWNARRRVRATGNQAAQNALMLNPALMGQLQALYERANTNRFSDQQRAAFLAPRQETVNRAFDSQRSRMYDEMAQRGLTDSSGAAHATGALYGRQAAALGNLNADLYQQEDARQREEQGRLLDALNSLFLNQQSLASGQGMQLLNLRAQQQQGGGFAEILGALGSLAGGVGGLM